MESKECYATLLSCLCHSILFFAIAAVNTMSCNPPATLTGEYSYITNPCITEPCLPGMTFAVLSADTYYYLTVNGLGLAENRSWDGYTPAVGELVTVTGYLQEEKDIFHQSFYTVEVLSLHLANREDVL